MSATSFSVAEYVLHALHGARKVSYPFPHIYVENVFPEDYYEELLASLPGEVPVSGYDHRRIGRFDVPWMLTQDFTTGVLRLFDQEYRLRFAGGSPFNIETRLVRDECGYFIGPHTDHPSKVISMLFYLPVDNTRERFGTSIYVPKTDGFRCEGGEHYEFEAFKKVWTAPYRRNSAFIFWKTANSFHGVEPIQVAIRRDTMLFNVNVAKVKDADKRDVQEPEFAAA